MNYIIRCADEQACLAAQRRWNTMAKPLRSLGSLEDFIVKIAGIQQTADVRVDRKCALVFCGDHGVVAEGVSQSGSDVTGIVAASIANGSSNVNLMANTVHADVFAIDMGMRDKPSDPRILSYRQGNGTANMTKGPAMTRAQAENAIEGGIDAVRCMKNAGYNLIAVGEMGIGNTTAGAAIVSVLMGILPFEVVGRGAGLSDEGLARKRHAVETAIAVNSPDQSDPIDVLAKVGGFDIAGMTGAFLGGMIHRIPIVIDGMISSAAALAAKRICAQSGDFMLASHLSKETAAKHILAELGLEAVLHARMGLGEGTGAVALFPLLDMALNVYNSSHTFDNLNMEAYVPLGGKQ